LHVHILTAVAPDASSKDSEALLAAAMLAMGRFPGHVTTAMAPASSVEETIAAIDNVATNIGADMIVVGSRGLAQDGRFLPGSVAAGVARTATCPVLVARPPAWPLEAVVIGINDSAPADAALNWVTREMPLPEDCELLLVRVADAATAPAVASKLEFIGTGLRAEAFRHEAEREIARQDGEEMVLEIQIRFGRPATFLLREGDPTEELITVATERDAGLIVTGSRGLTAKETSVLGSVSERLLQHASCSVLIVKETHAS